MIKNGKGGGNTKTGLVFEGKTDLATFLNDQNGYRVVGDIVFYNDEIVARIFKKHGFYRYLKEIGIDWTKIISKKLLPDDSIYVIINNTLFIIECKYQQVNGSVDEKLQTCDFKRKQYQKLMSQVNIDVEYIYLLSDWFKNPKYKDVLDYIISMHCQYDVQLSARQRPISGDVRPVAPGLRRRRGYLHLRGPRLDASRLPAGAGVLLAGGELRRRAGTAVLRRAQEGHPDPGMGDSLPQRLRLMPRRTQALFHEGRKKIRPGGLRPVGLGQIHHHARGAWRQIRHHGAA